jgi:allantoinase
MELDKDYLKYPQRSYGNDHQLYDWSMLADRPAVKWPNGKKLAVWINVSVQHFPLYQRNIPFNVPNGMTMPYPDLRHFSVREYGNRVGIYRLFKAFEKFNIRPTYAINAQLTEKHPQLVNRIMQEDAEILCHGWNMDHMHYGGQPREEEANLIESSLTSLREFTQRPINGWLSPAKNQSEHTAELLAEHGIQYCCDWINDDMPYEFNTSMGNIMTMPLSTELEDSFIINENGHSEDSWQEQVTDAFDYLLEEAEHSGGRLLALNIHPWLLGQPHRIACLENVLKHISQSDQVWQATAGEILQCFQNQE